MVQRMMFLGSYKAVDYHVHEENGMTEDTHSIFSFIKCEDVYENGDYYEK